VLQHATWVRAYIVAGWTLERTWSASAEWKANQNRAGASQEGTESRTR